MIAIGARARPRGWLPPEDPGLPSSRLRPGRSTLADPLDEKFVERVPAARTTRLPLVLLTLAAYPRLMSKDGRRNERDGEWGEFSYRTGRPTDRPTDQAANNPPVRCSSCRLFPYLGLLCLVLMSGPDASGPHPVSQLVTGHGASTFIPTDDSRRLLFNSLSAFLFIARV